MTAKDFIPSTSGKFQKIFTDKQCYTELIDDNGATSYICHSLPGDGAIAGSALDIWRISKIVVTGTITTIEWAQGDSGFNYKASLRASYSYA